MADLAGPDLPRSSAAVAEPTVHDPDAKGHFGVYGGRFVPEALMAVIEEVTAAYEKARGDQAFLDELDRLQRHYTGRPSPLYEAARLSEHAGGARIFLKREDLNHTGSHKINNVLGQALLAQQMGKTRVIAETGAGQHGVATATACALLGLECVVYMGAIDTARQALNVARMRLLGAEVVSVESGSKTLKDAINEAFRDWVTNADNTYYCFGTAAGPHPFPTMVRDFQRVIGLEARVQIVDQAGRLPDAVTACVGGGSNAIGIFHAFIDDPGVRLVGYEAAGDGVETGRHAATFTGGSPGAFQGSFSYLLQDEDGQTIESHSISAGLDYPGVGPEHAFLKDTGRAEYRPITDAEAMDAFALLCRTEGIIPAIESAHAVAGALKLGAGLGSGAIIVVNMSGRGDKDVETAAKWFGLLDGVRHEPARGRVRRMPQRGPVGADRLPADRVSRCADVDCGDGGAGRIRLRRGRSRYRLLGSRDGRADDRGRHRGGAARRCPGARRARGGRGDQQCRRTRRRDDVLEPGAAVGRGRIRAGSRLRRRARLDHARPDPRRGGGMAGRLGTPTTWTGSFWWRRRRLRSGWPQRSRHRADLSTPHRQWA